VDIQTGTEIPIICNVKIFSPRTTSHSAKNIPKNESGKPFEIQESFELKAGNGLITFVMRL
jgi:hypothetical protein